MPSCFVRSKCYRKAREGETCVIGFLFLQNIGNDAYDAGLHSWISHQAFNLRIL